MKINKSLIGFLAGITILFLAVFFPYRFLYDEFTLFIYQSLAFCGCLITFYYLARLLKIKYRYFVFGLIGCEIIIFLSFFLAKKEVAFPKSVQSRLGDFYMSNMRNTPPFHKKLGQYDPNLFYRFQPGEHTFKNLEFTTDFNINSMGCRDDEASLYFPKIICAGDSFTMGWGVDEEDSFPDLIEKATKLKTLNLGIPSYGTAREFLFLKKNKLDSCKTLILQFCENDIIENRTFVENNFSLPISSLRDYQSLAIANQMRVDYFPFKWTVEMGAKFLRNLFSRGKTETKNEFNKNQCIEDFFAIVNLIQNDFDGKVIIFHLDPFHTSDQYFQLFQAHLNKNPMEDVLLLDVSKDLEEGDYFRLDGHLKASGNRKVAQILLENI